MIKRMKIYRFLMMVVLINALLSQTFPKTLVLIDYYFHTEVYAAYCVNKEHPEMQCNGQCQLDKKMNDLNHHHDDSSRLVEVSFSNYYPPTLLVIQAPHPVYIKSPWIFHHLNMTPQDWFEKPLQPPQFLV